MQTTTDYYDKKAQTFMDETVDVDFSNIQNMFLELLPAKAYVLDFGCGSGRDTKYFLEQGCLVDAIDGSFELCKLASEYIGSSVKQMLFDELSDVEKYDGIWACASILHVKRDALPEILYKMCTATKTDGIIYISFKHGEFEGIRDGRYFTDMTEDKFQELLVEVPELRMEKCWVTGDVREGRGDERWLNLILRK